MTARGSKRQNNASSLPLHVPPLPFLPFDLVVEILCRLPVKLLLQLRCLCKSWNSLISQNSEFAKKHLFWSKFNRHRHRLLLSSAHSPSELLLYHSPTSSIFSSISTIHATQLTYSMREIQNIDMGVSTCDGIVCFEIDQSLALLCNPSIGKFNMMPPLKISEQIYHRTLYTIVYDGFTNNYKIFSLSFSYNKRDLYVHTLGTEYWRKIHDFPGHHHLVARPGIFVSDTVNWLARDSNLALMIVSFDLEKDSSQELLQPLFDRFNTITFGALRDCLCICSLTKKFCDVWIMNEYGNNESWTKLLRVPYIGDPYLYWHIKVVYISKDDQVLMELSKKGKFCLVIYDSAHDTFKIPESQNNIDGTMAPEVYVESLISPFSHC